MENKKQEPEWIIHYIANGIPCDCCGKIENPYIPGICDAHTHGLTEYFNHPELRIVLDCGLNTVGYILNDFCIRIRNGEVFRPGDFVDDVIEGYKIRIDSVKEIDDQVEILRIVFPDKEGLFPGESGCNEFIELQQYPLYMLESRGEEHVH